MLGIALLVGALAGEAVADWQLRRFKSDPANRGQICEDGLWSLSRHPNYFFEWLCWLAYPLIAIDLSGANPLGWLALLAPACMYWVLVYVSGIPPLEEHMLRSRGAEFRAVQARTRPFFPFPKVTSGHEFRRYPEPRCRGNGAEQRSPTGIDMVSWVVQFRSVA